MSEIPKWVLESLCYYDSRNPDNVLEHIDYSEEEYRLLEGDCLCDNCFYGRTKLASYIIDVVLKKQL